MTSHDLSAIAEAGRVGNRAGYSGSLNDQRPRANSVEGERDLVPDSATGARPKTVITPAYRRCGRTCNGLTVCCPTSFGLSLTVAASVASRGVGGGSPIPLSCPRSPGSVAASISLRRSASR